MTGRKRVEEHGAGNGALTERQGVYLEALGTSVLPHSTLSLASELEVARGSARLVLEKLEKQGLIEDIPKTVRSGQWRLTPAGRAALRRRS